MSRWFAVAASLGCISLLGCSGENVGSVTGKVTMDGQPLPNAIVTFTPQAGGRTGTGKTDANGQYKLVFAGGEGATIGMNKVSVTTAPETVAVTETSSDSEAYAQQAMGGSASDYDTAKVTEPIPARYNKNTELTFEVKSGSNVYDIELKSQ